MKKVSFIPAGSGERQLYLMGKCNDNTVRFVLTYPGRLDPDALKNAVTAVIHSADVLHGTFLPGALRSRWEIHPDVHETDYYQHHLCQNDPTQIACDLALTPIRAEDPVKLRIWLVQNDRESALAVTVSHLCADGSDCKYLLCKIIEAYNMLQHTKSLDGFQMKHGSRSPEQLYVHLRFREVLRLMKKPFAKTDSVFPYPTEESGSAKWLYTFLPPDVTDAARRKAKAAGATVNDLLIAALIHAYGDFPGIGRADRVAVTSMMDLRRFSKAGDSLGLCNMSGTMSTVLPHGISDSFEATLQEVASQTRRIKDDPDACLSGVPLINMATKFLPMPLLQKAAGNIGKSFSLSITNLGNIRCDAYAMDGIAPTGGLFGGPVKKKPAFQIAAMSFDSKCALSVLGHFTEADELAVNAVLKAVNAYLTEYAGLKSRPPA